MFQKKFVQKLFFQLAFKKKQILIFFFKNVFFFQIKAFFFKISNKKVFAFVEMLVFWKLFI